MAALFIYRICFWVVPEDTYPHTFRQAERLPATTFAVKKLSDAGKTEQEAQRVQLVAQSRLIRPIDIERRRGGDPLGFPPMLQVGTSGRRA
jgi:hypothetical protein